MTSPLPPLDGSLIETDANRAGTPMYRVCDELACDVFAFIDDDGSLDLLRTRPAIAKVIAAISRPVPVAAGSDKVDNRCGYCKEHGFQHPNLCEDCRAAPVAAGSDEAPADVEGLAEFYSSYSDEIVDRFRVREDARAAVRLIVAQAVMRDREYRITARAEASESRCAALMAALTMIRAQHAGMPFEDAQSEHNLLGRLLACREIADAALSAAKGEQ